MLSTSAQFVFAVEFVGLLVAAAGLVLVVLRADVTRGSVASRLLLVAAFVLLGAAAFAHGSQLLVAGAGRTLAAGRAAGALLLLAGARAWSGRRNRAGLVAGAVVTGAGAACEALAVSGVTVAAVLVAGSVLVGAALVGGARRSIAARVAVNAAGTLLLVVLVLSVALSSVISSTVQHQQLVQFTTRAAVEAGALPLTANEALESARLVAADLDALAASTHGDRLAPAAAARRIGILATFYPVGAIAYVPAAGGLVGASPVLGARVASTAVVGSAACGPTGGSATGGREVVVSRGRAAAVAAFAVCAVGARRLGTVAVQVPLDDAYLAGVRRLDPTVSLELATPAVVLAQSGPSRASAVGPLDAAGGVSTAATPGATSRVVAGRFVSTVPVAALAASASPPASVPAFSLVVSLPATSVTEARDSLLRTLFVIALGGALLALGLASLTGDRITSGLRRLTAVAKDVGQGRISQRAGVVSRDEVGALAGAFDAMVDSVEEKNAALRAAAADETQLRNRLEAVIAGMSDALVAVDTAGRITAFNRSAEDLVGVGVGDAVGRLTGEVLVLSGDDDADPGGRVARVDPSPWTAFALLATAAGSVPVAISSGAVLGPAGEVVGIVLVLRDLRREREVERMKSEFLSRVGHELRTPLTGILGYADILVRREVPPAQARIWHGEILDAAKRQLRIVQLLEFFASSGAGRLMLRPEPTGVDGLVTEAVAGWTERVPAGFRLTSRVDPGLPAVMADRRWMVVALGELIDNGVKFSPAGGQVAVRAERGSSGAGGEGATVAISVRDRGRGMTLDEQAHAFGEFEQGDASDTRDFGGLGLGLSAVLTIVTGLGGRVECRSAPDRGTTMTVILPAAAADQATT